MIEDEKRAYVKRKKEIDIEDRALSIINDEEYCKAQAREVQKFYDLNKINNRNKITKRAVYERYFQVETLNLAAMISTKPYGTEDKQREMKEKIRQSSLSYPDLKIRKLAHSPLDILIHLLTSNIEKIYVENVYYYLSANSGTKASTKASIMANSRT